MAAKKDCQPQPLWKRKFKEYELSLVRADRKGVEFTCEWPDDSDTSRHDLDGDAYMTFTPLKTAGATVYNPEVLLRELRGLIAVIEEHVGDKRSARQQD